MAYKVPETTHHARSIALNASVRFAFFIAIAFCLTTRQNAIAEDAEPASSAPSIDWINGPGIGRLGAIAEISVPKGYRFTGKDGAQKFM